jgi:tetratricopeptide (TPR) repeat protein
MAAFFLCTLYASIRSLRPGRGGAWKAVAVSACVAGAFAKETIAVAPLAVVLYDGVFAYPGFHQALAKRWRFYLALCAAWIPLAYHLYAEGQTTTAGFASAGISPLEYFLTQPAIIARYFWLIVWPKDLVLFYGWARPIPFSAAAPFVAVFAALFVAVTVATVKRRVAGLLGVLVFLTLGPSSSVIPIATEVAAERRMYLPLAAVAVLVALLVARAAQHLPRPRRVFAIVIGCLTILLAARTMARTVEYSSPLTMARTILARWPTPNAEYLVGSETIAVGDRAGGIPHLRRAVGGYPPARFALGSALLLEGSFDEAAVTLEAFIRDEPASLASRHAHALLAEGYVDRQRFADAVPHYRAYLDAFGDDANAWNALGVAQARAGERPDSLASFRRAVRLRPGEAGFWMNLGAALVGQGDTEGAKQAFSTARRLNPGIAVPQLPDK